MIRTFGDYRNMGSFATSIPHDRDEWLVAPVGRSRDSSAIEESNFAVALAELGGESETVEVCRFSHWAVGWVEEILVHPQHAASIDSLRKRLDDYPILDEQDCSEREQAERRQAWSEYLYRDYAHAIAERFSLSAAALDLLNDNENAGLLYYVFGQYAHFDDEPVSSNAERLPDRDYAATILKAARALKRGGEMRWDALRWRR